MDKQKLEDALLNGMKKIDSMQGVVELEKIASSVPKWLSDHFQMEHSNPSPSSINRCRSQQFYYAKGVELENEPPISWKRRAAIGIMAEAYWYAVFNLSGYRLLFPSIYKCGVNMLAHPDALLVEGLIPVEFKDKTGFQYKKLIEGAKLAEFDSGEYSQLQLYMYVTNTSESIYLAAPADPQMLQTTMRQKKQYGNEYNLPPFYLEVVNRNDKYIEYLLNRADILTEDLKSDSVPPREYLGLAVDKGGHKVFPCYYCPFIERCQKDQGVPRW